jgi:hypothetical protein
MTYETGMTREEIWQRGQEIVLSAPQLYIDVDVEADGIAGHGSMLSVGAQSPTGESYYSEIKPYDEAFLAGHRQFCEDHGLQHERLLAEAPELQLVMGGFRQWLAELADRHNKPPVFTAYNAAFDWAHVDLSFLRAGVEDNPFGIAPFDIKSLAQPLSGAWDFSKTKKSRLPSIIVPDGDFTHHALEDSRYQQKLHFGMAGLLGRKAYLAAAAIE